MEQLSIWVYRCPKIFSIWLIDTGSCINLYWINRSTLQKQRDGSSYKPSDPLVISHTDHQEAASFTEEEMALKVILEMIPWRDAMYILNTQILVYCTVGPL